jgi:hypothetical protein
VLTKAMTAPTSKRHGLNVTTSWIDATCGSRLGALARRVDARRATRAARPPLEGRAKSRASGSASGNRQHEQDVLVLNVGGF